MPCMYYDGEGYCERTGHHCPYRPYEQNECFDYVQTEDDEYYDEEDFL